MKYIRFIVFLMKHKYYVMLDCFKYGIPFRGLIHDLSKFLPWEMIPYVETCFVSGNQINYGLSKSGYMDIKYSDNPAYFKAVAHHKRVNKHHPEHWLFIDKNSKIFAMPMDRDSIFEMISDWHGAALVRGTKWSYLRWYWLNRNKILLHEETRKFVDHIMFLEYITCCLNSKKDKHAKEVCISLERAVDKYVKNSSKDRKSVV
jgi:hypothetical protein